MSESPFVSNSNSTLNEEPKTSNDDAPSIPVEIVSAEEMALIDVALASTRSSLSSSSLSAICSPSRSSHFQRNARSIQSITLLSKRRLSEFTEPEIEDLGNFRTTQKRSKVFESYLQRFRRKRGLSVTDITSTEWCEKQMEFVLLLSSRKPTEAMKAGSARHAVLEEEVVKKVNVRVETREDTWALKFLNFMAGANKLLFKGLTRELPLIGFVEGVWMVGIVDEVRMPKTEVDRNPMLVDTKTRDRDTLPSEPQRRNGRLQLMCYKYLWDNIIANNFPSEKFFSWFSLNPYRMLSEEVRKSAARSGLPAKTLHDVVRYYQNACSILFPACDKLLLRYELQKDNSVLVEDQFAYDSDWLKGQIQNSLEFWQGEREANYTAMEERWKCRYCQFAYVCPAGKSGNLASSPSKSVYATPPSSSNTDPNSTAT